MINREGKWFMDYIKPSMEFIVLDEEDIVCASTPGLTPGDGWDDDDSFNDL